MNFNDRWIRDWAETVRKETLAQFTRLRMTGVLQQSPTPAVYVNESYYIYNGEVGELCRVLILCPQRVHYLSMLTVWFQDMIDDEGEMLYYRRRWGFEALHNPDEWRGHLSSCLRRAAWGYHTYQNMTAHDLLMRTGKEWYQSRSCGGGKNELLKLPPAKE